ncbi:GATA domain-containing protein [Cephalotus follicularis]|uniref:GATA domain-containing protein n=1 Tax=Cephalotus follicularis TaxID=3775 RepID=A0A1Q3CBS6_CEPFO|nr:GATA domain-containing protein [Cephalotus follicularis]
MTLNYHSPLSSFPIELNKDQNQQLITLKSQASSSSSSLSYPIFLNPSGQERGDCYQIESKHLLYQDQVKEFVSHEGSCDHPTLVNGSGSGLSLSYWKKEEWKEIQSENSSVKWMPSKMRIMKKMMNTDLADTPSSTMPKFQNQKQLSSSLDTDYSSHSACYNNNNIRVCADCNTTKTPLWRSGPRGPKSLCNACGIRQRKARRAMAAAAAAAGNGTVADQVLKPSMKSKVFHKEKKESNGCVPRPKKKCKLTSQPRGMKKLCFEDLTIILSKNSSYQQDEKEAAILLMALSYGLVCG